MTSRRFAEVLLRTFGLFWLVNALMMVPYLIPIASSRSWQMMLSPTLTAGFYAAVGAGLLGYGGRIARRWMADEPDLAEPLTSPSAQAVGISILGLYFAVSGASYLASNGVSFFFEDPDIRKVNDAILQRDPGAIAASMVFLVAGLALFFGSEAMAGFWHRRALRARRSEPSDQG